MKSTNYFTKLYKDRRELVILEWAYLLIAVVSVFVAGLLALIDQSVGTAILIVPLIAIVAFSMNMISWAVLKLVIEHLCPSLKGHGRELTIIADKQAPAELEAKAASATVSKAKTDKKSK